MYKYGSHIGYETDTNAWTSVDVKFYTPACTSSCPIPPTVWPSHINVNASAGDTVAFYIQMTSGSGSFDGEMDTTEGSVVVDNGHLQLLVGKSQSGLGIFTGALDTGTTFQGDIYYSRINIVTAEATPDTICQGEAAALTALGNGLTSLWQPGGILGNNITVSPFSTTTYTVTSVDPSGCVDSTTVTVHVDTCLGIHGALAAELSVSPNPSDGRFVIRVNDSHSTWTVMVRDMAGRQLLLRRLDETANPVSLDVEPGIYFLELIGADVQVVRPIVIHR
jgi:hypothetical protein